MKNMLMLCAICVAHLVIGPTAMAQAVPLPVELQGAGEPKIQPGSLKVESNLAPPTASHQSLPAGWVADAGRTLSDRGVYPRMLLVGELAGNVSGGQDRGFADDYSANFGFDLDLDRFAGWKGASLIYAMNVTQGSSLNLDHTGNAVSFQSRQRDYEKVRLSALALEQTFLDGKVSVLGGRVVALFATNASPIWCTFQSGSVCLSPSVVPIGNRLLGGFPYPTWGGRIKIAPNDSFYVQAGVFEANLSKVTTDGFDWSTNKSTGHQIIVEAGVHSPSRAARHAYNIRFGGYTNSSDVTDPYLNTSRSPRSSNGGKPLIHDGQGAVYAMGDVVVTRLGDIPSRPVTLFGGVVNATNDFTPIKMQALVGAVATGPFPSRPLDTLGIVGSYIRLGDRQVDALEVSRQRAGGTDRVFHGQGVFELNYGFAVSPGVRLSPNIQYIVRPDNLLRPAAAERSENILAFGLRLTVDVPTLVGLPPKP